MIRLATVAIAAACAAGWIAAVAVAVSRHSDPASFGTVDLTSDSSTSVQAPNDPPDIVTTHVSLHFRITSPMDVGRVGRAFGSGSVAVSGSMSVERSASGCTATYALVNPRADYDVIRIFHVTANTYAVKIVYQGSLQVTYGGPCAGGGPAPQDSPFGLFLEFKVTSKTPTLAGEAPLVGIGPFPLYEQEVASDTSSRVRANSWTFDDRDLPPAAPGSGKVSYSIAQRRSGQPQATCTGSPAFDVAWLTGYSARFRTRNGRGVKASRWRFLNRNGGQIGMVDGLTATFKFRAAGRYRVNHTIANSCNQVAKTTKTITVPGR